MQLTTAQTTLSAPVRVPTSREGALMPRSTTTRPGVPGTRSLLLGAGLAASLALAACGGSSGSSSSSASSGSAAAGGGGNIGVSLITKDSTNPFFVAMQQSAKKNCPADGADIKVGSGKAEGD